MFNSGHKFRVPGSSQLDSYHMCAVFPSPHMISDIITPLITTISFRHSIKMMIIMAVTLKLGNHRKLVVYLREDITRDDP